MELRDCYNLLEVGETLDKKVVRAQYIKVLKKIHPDLHSGENNERATQATMAVNAAYDRVLRHIKDRHASMQSAANGYTEYVNRTYSEAMRDVNNEVRKAQARADAAAKYRAEVQDEADNRWQASEQAWHRDVREVNEAYTRGVISGIIKGCKIALAIVAIYMMVRATASVIADSIRITNAEKHAIYVADATMFVEAEGDGAAWTSATHDGITYYDSLNIPVKKMMGMTLAGHSVKLPALVMKDPQSIIYVGKLETNRDELVLAYVNSIRSPMGFVLTIFGIICCGYWLVGALQKKWHRYEN